MFNTNKSVISSQLTTALSKKIVPAMLSVALLSGFIIANNFSDLIPKVNAAPTVLYSTDFGSGANPGAAIPETDYSYYGGTANLNPGNYSILNNSSYNNLYGGLWLTSADHTGNSNGYFYMTDGTTVPGLAVFKKNLNLSANYNVKIDFWVKNALDIALYPQGALPQFAIEIRDAAGNIVSTTSGNEVQMDGNWHNISLTTVNPTGGMYEVSIASNQPNEDGNDFYLDDILITETPPAPTATNDTYTTVGTTPVILAPLTGDTGTGISVKSINSVDLTPGIAQIITIAGKGIVNVDSAGVIKFTANAGIVGSVTFPYVVTDTAGQTVTANENVTVTLPTAPTAANDDYTANGTIPVTITPLMGDTGTAIKIKSIGGTAITPGTSQTITVPSGTFSVTAAGVITYVANPSFTGTATVPYIIEDSAGQTATANIIIAPTPAITATNDNYTTVGTTPVTLLPLTGDTAGTTIKSINGALLTPGTAQVISVTGGNVNVSATGAINFNANTGFNGNATFSYVITAANGQTATADQTITVSAPVVSSSSAMSSSSVAVSSSSVPASSSSNVASSSSRIASSSVVASSSSLVASSSSATNSSSSVVASSSSSVVSSSSLTPASSSSIAVSSSSVVSSSSSYSSVVSVPDTDGVAPAIENAGPNNGDANKDGVLDSLQGNVASLVDAGTTPKYVVVAADPTSPCQTLSNLSTNTEVANIILDSSYDYPVGFVNFSSPCATSIKVKIFWYGLDTTKTYINRKFNAATGIYSDVAGITSTIENVNGSPVLTYTYTVNDNGPLDTNPAIGTITDPIGPVLAPVQNGNGGVITIGNTAKSSSTNISSSSIVSGAITTPAQSSVLATTLPAVVSPNSKSTGTIRTGGNSVDLIIAIIFIMSIGFVSSILEKSKANK